MTLFSCVLIGDESLTMACGAYLIEQGVEIRAVATRAGEVRAWAKAEGLPVTQSVADLPQVAGQADWLLSIANLRILPQALLDWPTHGAINFHDGPLPEYAGVNTPVWALLNGESSHGVTWHHMQAGIDAGDILLARRFDIPQDASAHALNARCYAEGLDSFAELVDQLACGAPARRPQEGGHHRLFTRADLPPRAGHLDFTQPVQAVLRQIRALDAAGYANKLATCRIMLGGAPVQVGAGAAAVGQGAPGTVVDMGMDWLTVMAQDGALRLSQLRGMDGRAPALSGLMRLGDRLSLPDTAPILKALTGLAAHEDYWRAELEEIAPLNVPLARRSDKAAEWQSYTLSFPEGLEREDALFRIARFAALSAGAEGDLAYRNRGLSTMATAAPRHIAPWVPLRSDDLLRGLRSAEKKQGFAADLGLRLNGAPGLALPLIGLSEDGAPVEGTVLSVLWPEGVLMIDAARLDGQSGALLAARLSEMLRSEASGLPEADRAALAGWHGPEVDLSKALTIHAAFEAQVGRTPDAPALVFEAETLSYAALNRRADAAAAGLRAAGVTRGTHVALCVRRGPGMLIGALAILKAGGAYVPLDPDYPPERLAHVITDSRAPIVLTEAALEGRLPQTSARLLRIEEMQGAMAEVLCEAAGSNDVGPEDTAYLIYTSGSTGLPKGVSISHGNVANFSAGMDAYIDAQAGGVWLALTSLAFDISVLELFHTLARGFKVVLTGGDNRAAVSGASQLRSGGPTGGKMRFGLYYWGNDGGAEAGKYHLLLEGAKFADAHGFTSLWTPERHFHAFGGAYPNPAVTGAAVASITKNLQIRAGSCVAPLHHPARIAEDWAVIDNLTKGRAGIAFASGWQPDDFVLRPENTPPANKPALYDTLAKVRALWRGEAVAFPTAAGGTHDIVSHPRPVQSELPVWITTAGNPDTWREAGALGAHVLTHLLGQSIEEVGEKIAMYHAALRGAGHDPADFEVTVMLHSYIADTRDAAREVARAPMKAYLRSAAGLIKQYAWAFPAFKKPAGLATPMQIDLATLAEEEMEAILDFAFERYFEDAGLFGTIDDALARSAQLADIGVTEIACLIDFGIEANTVLEGLRPLAEVLRRANGPDVLDEADFSLAAQILRHGVTHLQCTPSMARILTMNSEARSALAHIQHLYVGGEALPADLLEDLRRATPARIFNMYGPTETTIWSTVQPLDDATGIAPIGAPIANTICHVVNKSGAPVPIGVQGELWIGGAGVAKGYWQRPALTDAQFGAVPGLAGGRLYRTGDQAAWRADGTLSFFGRGDGQLKIRGQRIELGEIEARLAEWDGITGAVVTATGSEGDLRLSGYYTAQTEVDEVALRGHLARHLPSVMVPGRLIALDHFPLTPNKKTDRAALPGLAQQAAASAVAAARIANPAANSPAPDDLYTRIAQVWQQVLGLETVRPQDNFFALGGHSLLAVQAHRDIRVALPEVRLAITDIFGFPVLADLVTHLGGAGAGGDTPAEDPLRSATMQRRRAMRATRAGATG